MKPKFYLAIWILLCMISFRAVAQDVQEHKPKPYQSPDGKLFWNKQQPMYLKIMTDPSEEGILLKSEHQHQYSNPYYFDTEGKNLIRTRYAVDPKTRKAVQPPTEVLWEVYVDGISPDTKSEFIDAPKSKRADTTYYGRGLKVKLLASDQMSGTDTVFYKVNGDDYKDYNAELVYDAEGAQQLSYYTVDHVGNAEQIHSRQFYVDLTAPTTYYHITGLNLEDNILSASSVIYLSASDNASGVAASYYRLDDGPKKMYDGKRIPIAQLEDGYHTLTFYSVDKVKNEEAANTYKFYLDKLAPILASDVLGDRFIVEGEDKIYFSGRTKLKLTAVDNKSGIKEVLYSIDNSDFRIYDQPFYLPSISGLHIVQYYAVDNTENVTVDKTNVSRKYQEFKHEVAKIYVDLTGPSMSHKYLGENFKARDTLFINTTTKVQLLATDQESGFQYLSYSLDDNREELRYDAPFSITEEGFHKVEYFAYDNVNNRNKHEFTLVVDNTAPVVSHKYSIEPIGHKEGLDVYPPYVMLYLAATDKIIGTDKITYSVNGGAEQTFLRYVEKLKKDAVNTVKVTAVDKLGNRITEEIRFYVE